MINATDIRSAIVGGSMTNAELDTIQQAVTFARGQLAKKQIVPLIKVQWLNLQVIVTDSFILVL